MCREICNYYNSLLTDMMQIWQCTSTCVLYLKVGLYFDKPWYDNSILGKHPNCRLSPKTLEVGNSEFLTVSAYEKAHRGREGM